MGAREAQTGGKRAEGSGQRKWAWESHSRRQGELGPGVATDTRREGGHSCRPARQLLCFLWGLRPDEKTQGRGKRDRPPPRTDYMKFLEESFWRHPQIAPDPPFPEIPFPSAFSCPTGKNYLISVLLRTLPIKNPHLLVLLQVRVGHLSGLQLDQLQRGSSGWTKWCIEVRCYGADGASGPERGGLCDCWR